MSTLPKDWSRLPPDEEPLLTALRAGDEEAFLALVGQHQSAMTRVAAAYIGNPAAAEDVVQETWMRALRGLDRFEGRASLKTWLYRILTNTAITHGQREARTLTFADLAADAPAEPAEDPERFLPAGDEWAGHWVNGPAAWRAETLEDRAARRELLAAIQAAIDALPPAQRTVISLHDVEGWPSKEICNILEISESNQRVLLHRARVKVRQALERYFAEAANDER